MESSFKVQVSLYMVLFGITLVGFETGGFSMFCPSYQLFAKSDDGISNTHYKQMTSKPVILYNNLFLHSNNVIFHIYITAL